MVSKCVFTGWVSSLAILAFVSIFLWNTAVVGAESNDDKKQREEREAIFGDAEKQKGALEGIGGDVTANISGKFAVIEKDKFDNGKYPKLVGTLISGQDTFMLLADNVDIGNRLITNDGKDVKIMGLKIKETKDGVYFLAKDFVSGIQTTVGGAPFRKHGGL